MRRLIRTGPGQARQWPSRVRHACTVRHAWRSRGVSKRSCGLRRSGERDAGAYAGISQRLAMAEGAARVAVHRLRQRYGELLRAEIAQTVETAEEVDEDVRYANLFGDFEEAIEVFVFRVLFRAKLII